MHWRWVSGAPAIGCRETKHMHTKVGELRGAKLGHFTCFIHHTTAESNLIQSNPIQSNEVENEVPFTSGAHVPSLLGFIDYRGRWGHVGNYEPNLGHVECVSRSETCSFPEWVNVMMGAAQIAWNPELAPLTCVINDSIQFNSMTIKVKSRISIPFTHGHSVGLVLDWRCFFFHNTRRALLLLHGDAIKA